MKIIIVKVYIYDPISIDYFLLLPLHRERQRKASLLVEEFCSNPILRRDAVSAAMKVLLLLCLDIKYIQTLFFFHHINLSYRHNFLVTSLSILTKI